MVKVSFNDRVVKCIPAEVFMISSSLDHQISNEAHNTGGRYNRNVEISAGSGVSFGTLFPSDLVYYFIFCFCSTPTALLSFLAVTCLPPPTTTTFPVYCGDGLIFHGCCRFRITRSSGQVGWCFHQCHFGRVVQTRT